MGRRGRGGGVWATLGLATRAQRPPPPAPPAFPSTGVGGAGWGLDPPPPTLEWEKGGGGSGTPNLRGGEGGPGSSFPPTPLIAIERNGVGGHKPHVSSQPHHYLPNRKLTVAKKNNQYDEFQKVPKVNKAPPERIDEYSNSPHGGPTTKEGGCQKRNFYITGRANWMVGGWQEELVGRGGRRGRTSPLGGIERPNIGSQLFHPFHYAFSSFSFLIKARGFE